MALRPFDLNKYKHFSAEEMAIIIVATKAMWAILDPEAHGQERFRSEQDFVDAGVSHSSGLRAEFRKKPMQPYRRDWNKRHIK